jgi:hypothetical protein
MLIILAHAPNLKIYFSENDCLISRHIAYGLFFLRQHLFYPQIGAGLIVSSSTKAEKNN